MKTLKLLRFLKITRMVKALKMVSNRELLEWKDDLLENQATRNTIRILRIMLLAGFSCHIMGCVYVDVGCAMPTPPLLRSALLSYLALSHPRSLSR